MSSHGTFTWIFVFVNLAAASLPPVSEDLALEARLTPCELIEHRGYPCETTHVTTEDGYILQLDRVPYGIRDNISNAYREKGTSKRQPVLLVPAIFTASDIYFVNFPWQSPGFLFADNGFDVWAMNTREAQPYASHITLSQDDPKFWRFRRIVLFMLVRTVIIDEAAAGCHNDVIIRSFDEMGRYDMPACIDHVLNATGATKLTIVAFSQGFLVNLIFHSVRPEYSEKVNLLVGYGPVANITHMKPPFGWIAPIIPILECSLEQRFATTFSVKLGKTAAETVTMLKIAHNEHPLSDQQLFRWHKDFLEGHEEVDDEDRTGRPSTSTTADNVTRDTPPPYPLERIRLPIALFPSPGDTVATPSDVSDLVDRLGENVVFEHAVPVPTFRHLDFATGYRANDILHNVAIELMRKYAFEGR
ncbi:gastric triacylglycerol lipase-like [Dermacentor variabilis]|uniref:gastric triacylglycerol lipase-like n=1 Tax=Dermacentor variabilis TaxID=34621 RepID=UPI003F5BB7F0